jgi:hypothetical protein
MQAICLRSQVVGQFELGQRCFFTEPSAVAPDARSTFNTLSIGRIIVSLS